MAVGGLGAGNNLNPELFLQERITRSDHSLKDGLLYRQADEKKRVYLVSAQNIVFEIDEGEKNQPYYTNAIKRTQGIITSLRDRTASPVPSSSRLSSVQSLASSSRIQFNPQQYLQNKLTLPNHKIENGLVVSDSEYGKFVYLVSADNKVFSVVHEQEKLSRYAEDLRRTKDIVQQEVSRSPSVRARVNGKANLVTDKDIFSFLDTIKGPHVLVNAANNQMDHTGGIARVIAEKAGVGIINECNKLLAEAPVSAGQVLFTSPYGLKEQYGTSAVAHAVGPNIHPNSHYASDPAMTAERQYELLVQCYTQTVFSAGSQDAYCPVVFPPLSACNFGVDIAISIDAFKKGVKNAEDILKSMGEECPDVYLVLAKDYDSSDTIAQAESAFSPRGVGVSRVPSPNNRSEPSWCMDDRPSHSRSPARAISNQGEADESESVIFGNDIPDKIQNEFKELLNKSIFFLTPDKTIKAMANDVLDPVTMNPLNSYKEGEIVSYFPNQHPQSISVSSALEILRREGSFTCPLTQITMGSTSNFTKDLANHNPLPSD